MSSPLAVFVLLLIGFQFCSAQNSVSFKDDLEQGQTFYSPLLETTFPNVPGKVSIEMTTAFKIEICLQATVYNYGTLSDCSEGGYFVFDPQSSSNNQTEVELDLQSDFLFKDFDQLDQSLFTSYSDAEYVSLSNSTLLLPGFYYYLSVRYNASISTNHSTSQFELNFNWNNIVCNEFQVPLPSGVCSPAATAKPQQSNNIPTSTTFYYSFTVDESVQQISITSNFSDKADVLLGRRRRSMVDSTQIPLKLRLGGGPDSKYFNAESSASDGMSRIIFDSPLPGTWYFSVENPDIVERFISVNLSLTNCSGTGKVGPNCAYNTTDLTGNSNNTMYVGTGDYQYFTISSSELRIGAATEELDVPSPVVIASFQNYPTNSSYLLKSQGKAVNFLWSNANSSILPTNDDTSLSVVTWKVAVSYDDGKEFYVWANRYCPDNCEGDDFGDSGDSHGSCDPTTGTCHCDEDYEYLTCTPSGLSTLAIVLIVVFSVVLVIGIIVLVLFLLRRKQRASYDRL